MPIPMRIVLFLAVFTVSAPVRVAAADSPRIVALHQTACQFVEAEGGDKHYRAASFDACAALNESTGEKRLVASQPLKLAPGPYIFRVYNVDVPYPLGFWLRGSGFRRVTLLSVSGGGIKTGGFRDYAIELKAGEYRYSCPLNPTPDYVLQVKMAVK